MLQGESYEISFSDFPADWNVLPLGELMKLRGETIQPIAVPSSRYVGLEHIDSGKSRIMRWGSAEDVKSSKACFVNADILYGKLRPYLDKAALAEWDGICSTDILVFTTTPKTTPDFMVYALHSNRVIKHAIATTSGVNHPRTTWNALQKLDIPTPPLSEQRTIARVLTSVRQSIETTERVIAAARELKRSLMKYLFTYGPVPVNQADQVVLKETEIGEMPKEWVVVKLGSVINKPQYGYTETASKQPIGPQFLRITDIQENGKVEWGTVPYCLCSKTDFLKYELKSEDLLVARIGATTGKCYIVAKSLNAVFASYLIRLRSLPEKLLPYFLYHYMNTNLYWTQIDATKGGRLKQGVNIPNLQNLLIPIPTIAEQAKISEILEILDTRIETESKTKAALEALFKSLLHHLMTGNVRVPLE
jgi:type I restriction enzyme S subunit